MMIASGRHRYVNVDAYVYRCVYIRTSDVQIIERERVCDAQGCTCRVFGAVLASTILHAQKCETCNCECVESEHGQGMTGVCVKTLRRRRLVGRYAFRAPDQGVESSLCCRIAGQMFTCRRGFFSRTPVWEQHYDRSQHIISYSSISDFGGIRSGQICSRQVSMPPMLTLGNDYYYYYYY